MNWQEYSKQIVKFVLFLSAAGVAYWLLHTSNLYEFTARENEGLNVLILLIGNIYAVMFAFVIFVIWGQFTDVDNFIMLECNSLRDVIRKRDGEEEI